MFRRVFTDHPNSVGETYGQHFLQALGFSAKLTLGGVACFVHALIPSLFEKTGSNAVRDLHARMVENRDRKLRREQS